MGMTGRRGRRDTAGRGSGHARADTLRFGILGTGNIAGQFARDAAGARRSVVVAAASRELAKAQRFAATHQIESAYGDYRELLADPRVEAVYITLPNAMHHPWTLAALGAGKHVLCEKSLAVSHAQAVEMFAAARAVGRVLVEAIMYRCHPQTLAALEQVRAGAIGEVRMIRASFCFRTRKIEGNIRYDPVLGGGVLLDVGCYCIDFCRLFADADPVAVHAVGHIDHRHGVDDWVAGTLAFPGGVAGSFTCGMAVQADNTAYVCGSEGYIEIPVPWKPPVTGAGFTIARSTPPRMDGGKIEVPPRQTISVDADRPLYALESDHFAATVLDGAAPLISEAASLANLRVIDQLRGQVLNPKSEIRKPS